MTKIRTLSIEATSVSVNGEQYVTVDGFLDVSEASAKILVESHGFVLAPDDDPDAPAVDDVVAPVSVDPASLNRNQLFAALKGLGVAVAPPITNDALRALLVGHTPAAPTAPAAPAVS
jgi:hypothetical protein